MRVQRHRFHNTAEAKAFICGINATGDDYIEAQDVGVGDDGHGEYADATITDFGADDGDEELFDHREHV